MELSAHLGTRQSCCTVSAPGEGRCTGCCRKTTHRTSSWSASPPRRWSNTRSTGTIPPPRGHLLGLEQKVRTWHPLVIRSPGQCFASCASQVASHLWSCAMCPMCGVRARMQGDWWENVRADNGLKVLRGYCVELQLTHTKKKGRTLWKHQGTGQGRLHHWWRGGVATQNHVSWDTCHLLRASTN